ncbi:MAG: hypothetical protein OXG04_24125 [Acidobacteria bacterium]|nr:hypothetical protein [Acidobacteriota bacterium]
MLIETLVEAVPPRPCDAAGLPDEMSGSPRDRATRAVLSKALRGRKSEKRGMPRIRAATPLRPDWLPMRCVQGLAISSGTLAQYQGSWTVFRLCDRRVAPGIRESGAGRTFAPSGILDSIQDQTMFWK